MDLLILIPLILLSLAIHEFAHAKFADLAGDPTPRNFGRVTLNPLAHLDPIGTIMIVLTTLSGFGIGWGKPVPMDPRKMRNPRWDHFTAVAAGPLSNLIQAAIYGSLFRIGMTAGVISPDSMMGSVLFMGTLINVGLFLFNLLPMGPLDGMWLFGTFLPEKQRFYWTRWNLQVGAFVFLGLVLIGQVARGTPLDVVGSVLFPASQSLLRFLLGL